MQEEWNNRIMKKLLVVLTLFACISCESQIKLKIVESGSVCSEEELKVYGCLFDIEKALNTKFDTIYFFNGLIDPSVLRYETGVDYPFRIMYDGNCAIVLKRGDSIALYEVFEKSGSVNLYPPHANYKGEKLRRYFKSADKTFRLGYELNQYSSKEEKLYSLKIISD